MNNSIKITIYDNEGDCILNDEANSPFVGLQAGETFWFGTRDNRTWAKVIKITYGLDTSSKCFVIEIIVEKSQKGETKVANKKTKFVDHGEKRIVGKQGGTWSINNSDIIVTTGSPGSGCVERVTLQVNSSEGDILKTSKKLQCGEDFDVITKDRKIICTLISADWYDSTYSTVRITESKIIK